ncbi:hypothetical protein MC885_006284, partial [Smutsia gigantea]
NTFQGKKQTASFSDVGIAAWAAECTNLEFPFPRTTTSPGNDLCLGVISTCAGYIKGPEQEEDTHTQEHPSPLTSPTQPSSRHHHDQLLLRLRLFLPELWGRLLPRPLLLSPRVFPDHRVPPRDLRAPLHTPHLRALPPPRLLRPMLRAGRLLLPHLLLPHVLHGRGLPPLLLGLHLLPPHLCAGPLLPPPLLPACRLPQHLQDLLLLSSSAQNIVRKNRQKQGNDVGLGVISTCAGYIKGPEQEEDTHTQEHPSPLTSPTQPSSRHHHDQRLLRFRLFLPELWGRLLPRPLLLSPRVFPDHRVPPRDLRAPLHTPHLRALPPPRLLRPMLRAGRLLLPHLLLPHVLHGRGLPPLLLGLHLLPPHLCAGPLLPPPLLPACRLPQHLQDLLLLSSATPLGCPADGWPILLCLGFMAEQHAFS